MNIWLPNRQTCDRIRSYAATRHHNIHRLVFHVENRTTGEQRSLRITMDESDAEQLIDQLQSTIRDRKLPPNTSTMQAAI